MKNIIYIGTFGFFGAISRYFIDLSSKNINTTFPMSILIINVSGCFFLSLFLTIISNIEDFKEEYRLGIATGFLGAFTTFSTLCKKIYLLLQGSSITLALSYALLTLGLGFFFCTVGAKLGLNIKENQQFITVKIGEKNK